MRRAGKQNLVENEALTMLIPSGYVYFTKQHSNSKYFSFNEVSNGTNLIRI